MDIPWWPAESRSDLLGETVERQFAGHIKAVLDDDHTFTLQCLDQTAVR